MRILYYTWFENSTEDMAQTLVLLGHELVKCNIPFQDYETDEVFARQLSEVLKKYACSAIFSFNFFPVIAKTAEKYQIKYISWIYDCPHWTLYSPAAKSEYNYIFVFDRVQYLNLQSLGILHLYHFPLAVNTRKICEVLGKPQPEYEEEGEQTDVSFVGSLYEHNRYDKIHYLPEYLKGYLEGVMQAQQLVYGYNFVSELLTDDVIKRMEACLGMHMPDAYAVSERELYAAALNEKITSQERISFLNSLSKSFRLTIYTASPCSLVPGAQTGGTVDYNQQMPGVFRRSKINLNMTLRSIQSGIPLRALDIMGAGGFLLSNYQQELAEQFEDGKELVLYAGKEELLDKTRYYLSHERERREIAYRGFLKVQKLFSYEIRVKQMFEFVQEEKGMK
ncbi:DUF3880 domain-containing protein [Lachnospiraceae bacterium 45-W7]